MSKQPAAKRRKGGPRILFLDIETAPILAHVWGLFDQTVGLNQIERDWSILSYSAKWQGDPNTKIVYRDVSKQRDISNDARLMVSLWKLLDKADIVVAQNGLRFDKKKIFARFALHGMPPPGPFKFVDTLVIAKRAFGFTSNKLEYLSDKLNKKFKKLKHKKYAGFELWRECMKGNQDAWKSMREYNMYDVLALEELYNALLPWDDKGPNHTLWHDGTDHVCTCGSTDLERRGFHYSDVGKFQRYRCNECGAWSRDRVNLLSKEKRASLHANAPR